MNEGLCRASKTTFEIGEIAPEKRAVFLVRPAVCFAREKVSSARPAVVLFLGVRFFCRCPPNPLTRLDGNTGSRGGALVFSASVQRGTLQKGRKD